MSEEQSHPPSTECVTIEDLVRDSDWSGEPDWAHMKAIQVSRLLDEGNNQTTTNYYFLIQSLALIRRVQALETRLMEMARK